jgi:DNA replication protein DnaC
MKRDDGQDRLKEVQSLLVELSLTTLARDLAGLLSSAENKAPAYSEFLYEALSIEKAARTERKIERRRRWSRLGPEVSLEKFDFSVRPQLSPQVVRELLTCRFIEERRNVIFVGRPSLGKTTIANAIGHAACRKGMSVYSVEMAEMLSSIRASHADGTYRKAFRRVTQPDLLIIEEAGFSSFGQEATNELFRIVSSRHLERSTLVVTNLPFRRWGEFLPSPAQAVAIADRLIDQATILRFSGKPFRNPRDIFGAPLGDE